MDATNVSLAKALGLYQRGSDPRTKKDKGEAADEVDPIDYLVAQGWIRQATITANKVFLCSRIVVNGRLHATDKLCLHGKFIVTDGLECEGNFTLCGSVALSSKPARVKNMIIMNQGTIYGDVVASSGAYIRGNCMVVGTLTVTGNLRLNGVLKCKYLNFTGEAQKFGNHSRLVVEGYTYNGDSNIGARLSAETSKTSGAVSKTSFQ